MDHGRTITGVAWGVAGGAAWDLPKVKIAAPTTVAVEGGGAGRGEAVAGGFRSGCIV